jgi:O-antigen/teichoic acid export membrane protein
VTASSPLDGRRPTARRHMGGGALASAVSQIAFVATTAITSVIVARVLGAGATGTYALAVTLLDSAVTIASLGVASGFTYVVAHHGWDLRSSVRTAQLSAVVLGLAGAAVGLVAYALLRDSVFAGLTPSMAIWTLASLPFAIAWRSSAAIAIAHERYELYGAAQALQAVVALVGTGALVWSSGVSGAIAAYAFSQVVCAVAVAGWMFRRSGPSGAVDPPGRLRLATSFGVKTWAANALQLLNYRLDIFILNAFVVRADVGVYSIAVSLTALGWILPQALESVLMPRAASLAAAAGEGEAQARESDAAVARATRHSVLLVVPTFLALVVILVVGIPIVYGPEFHRSIVLGLILVPGVLALGVGKVVSAVIAGRGRPILALYTVAVVMPITIGLYLVLIGSIGVTGAAVASTLSYGLSTAIGVYFFRRLTGIPLRIALVPTRADLRDYAEGIALVRARLAARRA